LILENSVRIPSSFSNNKTKSYFPQNTYDEGKSERTIGSTFEGAFDHAKNRTDKKKTQALYSNPHNRQFPIYRGTDEADVDDGSTGELEGVYGKKLVLLSRFTQVPITGILNDMINNLEVSPPKVTLPVLTFPNPDTILTNITEAHIDAVLG